MISNSASSAAAVHICAQTSQYSLLDLDKRCRTISPKRNTRSERCNRELRSSERILEHVVAGGTLLKG